MRTMRFSSLRLFATTIKNIGFSSDPAVTRFGPGRRNQTIIHY